MTKYGRPLSVAPPSSTRAMFGVVHQSQGLPLGLEPGDDGVRVHSRLDDLQSHFAPNRPLLLGHVDDAEAAFPDLLEQLVSPNFVPWAFADPRLFNGRRRFWGGLQEVLFLLVDFEERFDAFAERLVPGADLVEVR